MIFRHFGKNQYVQRKRVAPHTFNYNYKNNTSALLIREYSREILDRKQLTMRKGRNDYH